MPANARKVLHSVGTLLTAALVLLLVLLAYGSLNNRWYRVVTVEGESMAPTLRRGDLIVMTPRPAQPLPVNTVVVLNVGGALVTHRIIAYNADRQPVTKGDASQAPDQFSNPAVNIVGVCRLRLPWLGHPLLWTARLLGRA